MYSLSVIIPNYNGRDLLKKNLPSLFQALDSKLISEFEVIVADDSSVDDSVNFLMEVYPDIKCIKASVNLGFSGNINRGIRESKFPYLLLLNSDVQVDLNYFDYVFQHFEDKNCFGVACSIYDSTGKVLLDAAKYPKIGNISLSGTLNYTLEEQTSYSTLFVSAACALVSRQKILALNCFEELYSPYYFEDSDLGLKAWKVGYTCIYESRAKCYHATSSSIGKEKKKKVKRVSYRNKLILLSLHVENSKILFLQIKIVFKLLLAIFMLNTTLVLSIIDYYQRLFKIYNIRKNNYRSFKNIYSLNVIKTKILEPIKNSIDIKFF